MPAQRNGCEPFAQPFLDEGLRAAANKLTDCNARKTKEIPKKIRDLFNLLGLPLSSRFSGKGDPRGSLGSILEKVTHAVGFGLQIEEVVGSGIHLDGHTLSNDDAEFFELIDLVGIVRQETHALDAQVTQNLRAGKVLSFVALKAERKVCFERIEPLLLQLIGTQLIDETDAAAFLAHIEQDAPAFLLNLRHCGGELLTAVAAQRPKAVAR